MESYEFYPPQLQATQIPYLVQALGAEECQHELLDEGWNNRITVQDDIVFVAFSCRNCGRKVCQSLDQVMPPASWNGSKGQ